jgi:ubiquinone/menaquinone biosynthesis C-methylase UbiE
MWRIWHQLLIRFDHSSEVNFMNYGYAGLNGSTQPYLEEKDEHNRYCIQLYDHLVSGKDLKDKKMLEIGSGRGGGADYIARYYNPDQYLGVDISEGVIHFCNKHYKVKGLSFKKGSAESIPEPSESFDAVVNVESARCYRDIRQFFEEVYRVLIPGGSFLFADMMEEDHLPEIKQSLKSTGFSWVEEKDITANVVKGLEKDSKRREKLIQGRIPRGLRKSFKSFAGTRGTNRFNSFSNGKYRYYSFTLKK